MYQNLIVLVMYLLLINRYVLFSIVVSRFDLCVVEVIVVIYDILFLLVFIDIYIVFVVNYCVLRCITYKIIIPYYIS